MSNESPIQRVLARMQEDGLSIHEMSVRLRKRPGTIRMFLEHGDARAGSPSDDAGPLRPIERIVLRGRDDGDTYGQIGSRIGRSGAHTRRIAGYARFKLGQEPLAFD